MLFPLLNPVAKCFAIVIRHECEPLGERANRVFPFVCDSFLRPVCEMSGRNMELFAKTCRCPLDVGTRHGIIYAVTAPGLRCSNRHSTMKRRQTLRMPVPGSLSRLESAIVLKPGAKRPVAGVLRCARLRRAGSACLVLRGCH